MSTDFDGLAARAVASQRWEWRTGMSTRDGAWVVRTHGESLCIWRGGAVWFDPLTSDQRPDLSDDATVGALLGLVQDLHGGIVWLEPRPDSEWWVWRDLPLDRRDLLAQGYSMAEALVAALEAAP